MKTVQPSRAQPSRAIANAPKSNYGGKSFPAVQFKSAVVQRVGESKQDLTTPMGATLSTDVPDMTTALVTEFESAKLTPSKATRQDFLDHFLAYLVTGGVVDNPAKTEIRYVAQNGHNNKLADTGVKTSGPTILETDPMEIRVYIGAFGLSAAAFYSMMRHELIHVGQNQLVPDIPVGNSDKYMHVDLYEPTFGAPVTKDLQLWLQEIEAHAWEIENAAKTGITSDPGYLQTTKDYLLEYAKDLVKSVKNNTPAMAHHWYNYIAKAIGILKGTAIPAVVTEGTNLERETTAKILLYAPPTTKKRKTTSKATTSKKPKPTPAVKVKKPPIHKPPHKNKTKVTKKVTKVK